MLNSTSKAHLTVMIRVGVLRKLPGPFRVLWQKSGPRSKTVFYELPGTKNGLASHHVPAASSKLLSRGRNLAKRLSIYIHGLGGCETDVRAPRKSTQIKRTTASPLTPPRQRFREATKASSISSSIPWREAASQAAAMIDDVDRERLPASRLEERVYRILRRVARVHRLCWANRRQSIDRRKFSIK